MRSSTGCARARTPSRCPTRGPLLPDDLARGRRRLVRTRGLTSAAALVVVGVVASVALGAAGTDDAAPDPAAPPGATATDADAPTEPPSGIPSSPKAPVDTRDGKELLTDWAQALAESLDPGGRHLDTVVTGYQGSGRGLGAKLGWSVPGEEGLGLVQVFVSPSLRTQFDFYCSAATPCRDVTVDGVAAQVQEMDGTTQVAVEREDGSVATVLIDPLFGNNSVVPVSGMDITVPELVRAAADPRLTVPTRRQIANVDTAFGFPTDY